MRTPRKAAVILLTTAAVLALPYVAAAQEGKRMETMLRPYLDPDFIPKEGPDTDKEFIRHGIRAIRDALPEKLPVPDSGRPKVLVLTQGTYGVLHVPGAAGLLILLRESAARHGAFELRELYDDQSINAEMLEGYDAVVLNQVGRTRRPEVFNEILPTYVRGGGGLFAVHSTALLYKDEPEAEFNKLLGAYVDTVNTKYGHPTRQGKPFPVVLPRPDHPLVAAFRGEARARTVTHRWLAGKERKFYPVTIRPPAELADELYALIPAPDQKTRPEVLVAIEKEKASQVYPESSTDFAYALNWIKQYGQGRVFYTQFGHNMGVYSVPCVARSMLDGLLYVASKPAGKGASPK